MSRTSPIDSVAIAAQAAGSSWADGVRVDLKASGRDVGMWPGTLSEARALAGRVIGDQTRTQAEREEIARAVYAAARSSWNANRNTQRDNDEPPSDE
jgi:hypothetical protein